MAKLRAYRLFAHITLVFLGVYVLCVLTNILVLPNRAVWLTQISSTLQADLKNPDDGAIHGGSKTAVKLLDRSVPGKVQVIAKPCQLLLLFTVTAVLLSAIAHKLRPPSIRLLANQRCTYLSLQTLLI